MNDDIEVEHIEYFYVLFKQVFAEFFRLIKDSVRE